MKGRRWFLPDQPDVIGLLRAEVAVTIEAARARDVFIGSSDR